MNDNKLLAISPTLPGLKATFFLPIYQVPDIVYPPFAYWGKNVCIMLCTCTHNPKSDVENTCHPFFIFTHGEKRQFSLQVYFQLCQGF